MDAEVLDRATAYSDTVAFENKNEHGYYKFKATGYAETGESGKFNLYKDGKKVAYLRIVSSDRYELVVAQGLSTYSIRISEGEFHRIRKIACDNLEYESGSSEQGDIE